MRSLDTSFVTDRIYALRRTDLSFSLVKEVCVPPFTKRYEITLSEEDVASAPVAIATYEGGALRGFAVLRDEAWNRRAVVTDFFVDCQVRRRGLGRSMMEELCKRLVGTSSRDLWIETQNVNLPAIEFYRRVGFKICGLDSTLYAEPLSAEVAVYLSMGIEQKQHKQALEPGSVPK